MYYSKNHKGMVFIDRGMGELEISGEGRISAADTEVWNPDENWKKLYTTLTLHQNVTAIGEGVIEQFPNVQKLILPKTLTHIAMTDALRTFLRTNEILICAAYGSLGDAFAHDNGLRFWPQDMELGWYRNEEHEESTKLILRFHQDGSMDLLYDIFTTGISPGANGGASLERPMPDGYFPGCSLQQFAELFPGHFTEQIMKNPEVQAFLKRESERERQPEQF